MDVVLALAGLALLWPVLAAAALLIRLSMGRPILFRQTRTGIGGRTFTIYKFRTMSGDRDDRGKLLPDDQRLTGAGRLIRNLSLDEFPQLWNVLKGEMSLVGPRPLLPKYLPRYDDFQRRRHEVKPGITGWAQVNGRNAVTWERKFELDVWYVDHRSLWLDCTILWLTLRKVVSREGISRRGHATTPEFKGMGNAVGQHE
jgi:lipopolysaccharide/colanic/teichoic acid biosynthesis glycosyltransferase